MTRRERVPAAAVVGRVVGVLVHPVSKVDDVLGSPASLATGTLLGGVLAVLGIATLPRQLSALGRALAPVGDALADAQHAAMWDGLLRLVVVDRLVPLPSVLLAAGLLVLLAEPVLALPAERRAALVGVVVLGLAPLVVHRLGELGVTYLAGLPERPAPGEALRLPHRFVTGPLLLVGRGGAAPGWAQLLEPRFNLVALWCGVIWAVGLRRLDGGALRSWHGLLPLGALAAGGVLSWACTGPVVRLVLG